MRDRFARSLHWLLPGVGVKRWIVLSVLGTVLLLDAVARWFIAQGTGIHVNEILDDIVDDYFPPAYLTWILGVTGIASLILGLWMWLRSVARIARGRSPKGFRDALVGRRLQQGYKIVAIGGGTGLSTLLRGLKRRTSNLTAVVTVSDDGGSSGRLQKELGVLPPGDVRNCLVALADDEALVTDLFRYRFTEGEGLTGHSFGNLFLAAMSGITGNFDQAIKESSRVLNVVGRVLPATLGIVRLCAELDDGSIVQGESQISQAKRPIKRVFFDTPPASPLDEVIAAIREADAIVLGPGSLFTSVAPNFLVGRIAREVAHAHAVKMYVCNVMTQPGETDEMTAADHVNALLENAGERVCDYVIVNDEPPSRLLGAYAQEGQVPVAPDVERIVAMGLEPVRAAVIGETETVRHDPEKLATVVLGIIDRTVADRATLVKPASAYRRSTAVG
ncbi:MAG: YvcK family protein [Candidatus Eremiobacteraeota bacterium]|nr:YvcK family protein [Candidatus Eremiobacteraeota bacterium]